MYFCGGGKLTPPLKQMIRKKPIHKDLQEGRVLEIYSKEGFVGVGKLLRRKPSRHIQDGLPYIGVEKPNRKQQNTLYIYSTERWEISWEKHSYYRKGDISCVHISYYMKVTTDQKSYYDINDGVNSPAEINGLYVFLEEDILIKGQDDQYTDATIKALKRVLRSFNGGLVIYTHSPLKVKERFELGNIRRRIIDFIQTDKTFEEGIVDFLDLHSYEDYLILAGHNVGLPNTLVYKDGLKMKKK